MDFLGSFTGLVMAFYASSAIFINLAQASSLAVIFGRQPERHYAVVNRVYEVKDNLRSLLHCGSLCLASFRSECRAVAYSADVVQGNCILISTRTAVNEQLDITPSFTLFSRGTCTDGYILNPNTGTCVGLQASGNWSEAKEFCENNGEYLLTLPTIRDAEWLEYQRSIIPDWYTNTWIGGYREKDEVGRPWYWRGRVTAAITYRLDYWDSGDQWSDADCMVIWSDRFAEDWCGRNQPTSFYCEAEATFID